MPHSCPAWFVSVCVAATVVWSVFIMDGCAWMQAHAVDALSAIQLGCVFESSLTDSKAVAEACGFAQAWGPEIKVLIEKLIGQREAAKSAGLKWGADAGADAK